MDDIDRLLLDAVQADAARPLHELGDAVGLSPSAVQRRLAGYRKAGLLSRQVAVLDPDALGGVVLAVVLVTLERESAARHAEFRRRLVAEPRVQQCYDVTGEWDYVVLLVGRDLRHCRQLAADLFMEDGNVRRFDTMLVIEPVKTGSVLPVGELTE